MIVLPAASSAVTCTVGAAASAPGAFLSSSPPSRSYCGALVHASAYCPPKSGTRAGSTRFAPALSKSKTKRRRRGSGGGGDDFGGGDFGGMFDGDWFFNGPWDGLDDAPGGGGGDRGRYGGRGGGGGGGSGWSRSNSEYGDWPALGAHGLWWQVLCAASLLHSFFFLIFPDKHAEPAVPPFSARANADGLC